MNSVTSELLMAGLDQFVGAAYVLVASAAAKAALLLVAASAVLVLVGLVVAAFSRRVDRRRGRSGAERQATFRPTLVGNGS